MNHDAVVRYHRRRLEELEMRNQTKPPDRTPLRPPEPGRTAVLRRWGAGWPGLFLLVGLVVGGLLLWLQMTGNL